METAICVKLMKDAGRTHHCKSDSELQSV